MHILIFAKQPKPGFAKTRLIPALGEQGAARLAERLLQHAVQQAVAADIGPVSLVYAPDNWAYREHGEWPPTLDFIAQKEGTLGERMARACARVQGPVLVMGTDCPALSAVPLRQLSALIKNHDAGLIPANDGGYVALAMRRFQPAIFSDIDWSTERVAAQTRSRFQSIGWRWRELPALVDMDEPDDLQYLPEGWLP